jgi:TPR repeat protein
MCIRDRQKSAHALALILRSSMFLRLTDAYGDVPYFEAGKATEEGVIETPKYDSQKSIYEDCFKNLTEAISLIGDNTYLNTGTADFVYNGGMQLWKKYANSLRFRMALRVSQVDETLAANYISEVLKSDLISGCEESAAYARFETQGYNNPLWADNHSNNYRHMSKRIVDFCKNNNDPRLTLWANPNQNGEYVGLENGRSIIEDVKDYSYMGEEIWRIDRATPILMYEEVCFMYAEIYVRGLGVSKNLDTANEWYRKGIEASMQQWNANQDDIDVYMENEPIANLEGDVEHMLEQIGTHKWAAFMDNGYEAYAEVRRMGYPVIADRKATDIPEVSLGDTNGKLPRRLKYPNNEELYNTENYKIAAAATDNNGFLAKVWWDVK